jgi:hypothetical protein
MLFTPRPKGLGKDSFLKLNDKEEVAGLFRGEIYTFKRHWTNNQGVECQGENCQVCKVDPENYASFRFRINFITTINGQWVAKIFEGGGEIYDQLENLDRKYDLSKTVVEIIRRGLKQNTKYDILPMNRPVTPEMEQKIKSVTLLALSAERAQEAVEA